MELWVGSNIMIFFDFFLLCLIYSRFSYGTCTFYFCVYTYALLVLIYVLLSLTLLPLIILFSLSKMLECCKAQLVCVYRRITLYKSYLFLL